MSLVGSVTTALTDVTLRPCDRAAADLALAYAAEIDAGETAVEKIGPALLAVLESLGMTPRARKAIVREVADAPASPLDELRQRRARRPTG